MNSKQSPANQSERPVVSASFMGLYEADKNRLYAYIYAFVLNDAAADDIFQEASLTLWREFHRFELGTSFSKWANGIAFNRIRSYKRQQNRYHLDLDESLLEQFYQNKHNNQRLEEKQENKWSYLQSCTAQLPTNLKQIYRSFYVDNCKAKEIAEQTGRSIHGVRKSVHALRKKLFDCIEKKQSQDEQ